MSETKCLSCGKATFRKSPRCRECYLRTVKEVVRPACGYCGEPVRAAGRKFCSPKCSGRAKRGIQPEQLKPIVKARNLAKANAVIKDGSVDAGLMLLSRVPKPDGGVWSQREIGMVCGVSHEYIRQLEKRAIRKLRDALSERLGPRGLSAVI
jgi:hypothetical protein